MSVLMEVNLFQKGSFNGVILWIVKLCVGFKVLRKPIDFMTLDTNLKAIINFSYPFHIIYNTKMSDIIYHGCKTMSVGDCFPQFQFGFRTQYSFLFIIKFGKDVVSAVLFSSVASLLEQRQLLSCSYEHLHSC